MGRAVYVVVSEVPAGLRVFVTKVKRVPGGTDMVSHTKVTVVLDEPFTWEHGYRQVAAALIRESARCAEPPTSRPGRRGPLGGLRGETLNLDLRG